MRNVTVPYCKYAVLHHLKTITWLQRLVRILSEHQTVKEKPNERDKDACPELHCMHIERNIRYIILCPLKRLSMFQV